MTESDDARSRTVRYSMDFKAAVLERRYVHEVYEKIAREIGQADRKAWPKVEHFLRSLPTGSLVADIGKYSYSLSLKAFRLHSGTLTCKKYFRRFSSAPSECRRICSLLGSSAWLVFSDD